MLCHFPEFLIHQKKQKSICLKKTTEVFKFKKVIFGDATKSYFNGLIITSGIFFLLRVL